MAHIANRAARRAIGRASQYRREASQTSDKHERRFLVARARAALAVAADRLAEAR